MCGLALASSAVSSAGVMVMERCGAWRGRGTSWVSALPLDASMERRIERSAVARL